MIKEKVFCDKCGKEIKNDRDRWEAGTNYNFSDKPKVRVKEQLFFLKLGFELSCGNGFDLCEKCFWKLASKKSVYLNK